jgi:hypothetical protein
MDTSTRYGLQLARLPQAVPPKDAGKKHQKRRGVISYIIWGFIFDILHSYGKAILYGSIF